MLYGPQNEIKRLRKAERLWLFLDYDGTLAEFAPTPDDIYPDPELIQLLTRLKEEPTLRIAILSGRRLNHIRKLLPLSGILLAGTYGIEYLSPEGKCVNLLDYKIIRPDLERLKSRWKTVMGTYDGFYLEDKDWSLAIHARFADEEVAYQILESARKLAQEVLPSHIFQILDGQKFLEVAPKQADKGRAIAHFLEKYPWDKSIPVYIGDDDKDEKAFACINDFGGVTILVSKTERDTSAVLRLESTDTVRNWLQGLLEKHS